MQNVGLYLAISLEQKIIMMLYLTMVAIKIINRQLQSIVFEFGWNVHLLLFYTFKGVLCKTSIIIRRIGTVDAREQLDYWKRFILHIMFFEVILFFLLAKMLWILYFYFRYFPPSLWLTFTLLQMPNWMKNLQVIYKSQKLTIFW